MITTVTTGVYLLVLSVEDMFTKSVGVVGLLLGAVPMIISLLAEGDLSLKTRLLGLIPGMAALLVSRISRGKIGLADAIVLCVLGFTIGIYEGCAVLAMAFLLLTAYSVALLARGRLKRNSRVAFLPFLFVSFAVLKCAGING